MSEAAFLAVLEAQLSGTEERRSPARVATISFDLDGTLANTFQAILDQAFALNTRHAYSWKKLDGSSSGCVAFDHSFKRPDQLTYQEFEEAKRRALSQPEFWQQLEAFDSDELAVIAEDLDCMRYAAVFVANRMDPAHDARIQSLEWLHRHGIRRYLHTCFDCTDKVLGLLQRGVDYHLDDDPDEVERLRKHGIEAFLVTRPWNQFSRCKFRVESVLQFLDIVAPVAAELVSA